MTAQTILKQAERFRIWEVALWLAAVAAIFFLPHKTAVLTEIAILALFALSLDLILGYTGILSLGHTAFFGLGAYSAGILAKNVTGDPILGLAVAASASAVLGFVSSFLILRGSDLTRLMTTLGVAMLLLELVNKNGWLTGGADGLSGAYTDAIFGIWEFDLRGRTALIYSVVVLFIVTMIARRIVNSPFGLSLKAIKRNPMRAKMLGIDPNKRIIAIYTIAAAIAGIAGALLTQRDMIVSIDVLNVHRSADLLMVLVIGGVGYLYGGMIGAVVFVLLRDYLSVITPQYWMFWIGLILIAIVMMGRERMNSLPTLILSRLTGRKTEAGK